MNRMELQRDMRIKAAVEGKQQQLDRVAASVRIAARLLHAVIEPQDGIGIGDDECIADHGERLRL